MGRRPLRRALEVLLNGRHVGIYRMAPDGGTSFEYIPEWLEWEHAFPVSRQLPLLRGSRSGEAISAVFENLLPDSAKLRSTIAEKAGARSARPFDLLAAIGHDCVGALQFVPEGMAPQDPFAIQADAQSDGEIAETLRRLDSEPLGIAPGQPFRVSLAGAQEKTAYLKQGTQWYRPRGLTPTTHIFKRPMGLLAGQIDLTDSVENEFFCLRLARELGLPVNHAEIARFEDEKALVLTRFDRGETADGRLIRLPQEDFLQAMGLFSAAKYQSEGGPGILRCLELLSGSKNRFGDMKTFLKAQVVFWMIGATDGHAKNFSIFLEPDGFRLTPLYDILSAAPAFRRNQLRNRELQLAMSAGDRKHYRIDQLLPRHFDQTAIRAKVPEDIRRAVFNEIAEQGQGALTRARADLPEDFPERIVDDIIGFSTHKLAQIESYAEAMRV
ncbi:HipA domain-containing protein [Paracoccus cavernae]|uniref:HipA domain-containing protein n=1 Tax=Paracoccus cavernae TaxID=1571207 RepID=UPI0035F3B16B